MTPLLGVIIGYITNDIAIRILSRPHKAKYIGSFQIPFTPSLLRKAERHKISYYRVAFYDRSVNESDRMN